jgi:hypothetical protein
VPVPPGVGAGRESPLGDDEALVVDLRRRYGERSGLRSELGHGGFLRAA